MDIQNSSCHMENSSLENGAVSEQIQTPFDQLKVADVFSCLKNDNLCQFDETLGSGEQTADDCTSELNSEEPYSMPNSIEQSLLKEQNLECLESLTFDNNDCRKALNSEKPSGQSLRIASNVDEESDREVIINNKDSSLEASDSDQICPSNTESCLPESVNGEDIINRTDTGDENSKKELDSFISEDQSYSEISASLSNLLSCIESENCNGLDHENINNSTTNHTTAEVEGNITESAEEKEKNITSEDGRAESRDMSITPPKSEKRLTRADLSPLRKRIKLSINESKDSNSDQSNENVTNCISKKHLLREVKTEKTVVIENSPTVTDWRNVIIKSEDNNTEENQAELTASDLNQSNEHIRAAIESLPEYLLPFTKIRPSVVVTRIRTMPNGDRIKVRLIKIARLVNGWIFKETFLSFFDRAMNLRQRLDLGGTPFIYSKSTISDLHPVAIGSEFPFSLPKSDRKAVSKSQDKLPPPLSNLVFRQPEISSSRQVQIDGKLKTIPTVNFAQEMLDCAFKESLLSEFRSAPDASYMLNVEHTWPDCSFEALDATEIDYKFPFTFPDNNKDRYFFDPIDISLPMCFFEQGQNIGPLSQQLKKRYYMTRDCLLRLLGTTTFYLYSATLADLEGNTEKSLFYNSIVCSLRPLVISQANELGNTLVDIRQSLLSEFVCTDNNVILSLIKGPICYNGYFFGNVKNLEKNMKCNKLVLRRKQS